MVEMMMEGVVVGEEVEMMMEVVVVEMMMEVVVVEMMMEGVVVEMKRWR